MQTVLFMEVQYIHIGVKLENTAFVLKIVTNDSCPKSVYFDTL